MMPVDLSDQAAVRADLANAYLLFLEQTKADPGGAAATVAVVRNADTLEDAVRALTGYGSQVFQAGVVYAIDRIHGDLGERSRNRAERRKRR